jgi:hypothetical protein
MSKDKNAETENIGSDLLWAPRPLVAKSTSRSKRPSTDWNAVTFPRNESGTSGSGRAASYARTSMSEVRPWRIYLKGA